MSASRGSLAPEMDACSETGLPPLVEFGPEAAEPGVIVRPAIDRPYLATKLVYRPLNAIGNGAVARHLFYNDYMKAISAFGWREQHTIVFDHLVAPTAFYISREEFAEWWNDIGASDVQISWHNKNSWRGLGRTG